MITSPPLSVGSPVVPGFGGEIEFALGSCLVDDLKMNLRFAGLTLSFRVRDLVSIRTNDVVVMVVVVVADVVVLVVAPMVVDVVGVVVVVEEPLHTAGTLSGLAGSVPSSSSLRSGQPSRSRSMPTRTPSPGGTQV